VGADPPHRVSRRERLEEPPKPSRSLSVAVATKAPERAFPFVCAASESPRVLAPGGFTLEARIPGNAPGLGGAHPRSGHPPSYRQSHARGPWTSRVPEPAPLRMRSRRGLRVRLGPSSSSLCWRHTESVRAPYSPALIASPSSRPSDSFALGRACPWLRNCSHGRRDRRCVRSTSAP